jgi:hypothetical protein
VRLRLVPAIGLVAVASLVAAGLYAYWHRAPACDSNQALDRVYAVLRDEFQFDSVLLNDVATVSGGFLAQRRECSAQVAQIRGNVNASDMRWRAIRYWIAVADVPSRSTVKVQLGGAVPLAAPQPSLWQRLVRSL